MFQVSQIFFFKNMYSWIQWRFSYLQQNNYMSELLCVAALVHPVRKMAGQAAWVSVYNAL